MDRTRVYGECECEAGGDEGKKDEGKVLGGGSELGMNAAAVEALGLAGEANPFWVGAGESWSCAAS